MAHDYKRQSQQGAEEDQVRPSQPGESPEAEFLGRRASELICRDGGVRVPRGGARGGSRVCCGLVGPRDSHLRGALRNDAIQGQEPEGDVSKRLDENARVYRETDGANGLDRTAVAQGPHEAVGVRQRRERDQGARVLSRGEVGHTNGGYTAAVYSVSRGWGLNGESHGWGSEREGLFSKVAVSAVDAAVTRLSIDGVLTHV